ncbi:hypothetical protein CO179_01380 [candidate division WWE3 bacterium CG_4_9_14_3_um_filter_39_7]|uniref:AB hydrolase-1 domain-containing protein n=1 Tax=candidate division WWE3 bacterium CG_4_9_14_3_um_filter_39_7 TaxID=1975080 RepID=A0A2M7X3N9_UNCKA|nr:MAG: hypothetical protein CO179_01380 [candidate division WWE3 bacterium CG_4_9_14_3_um_filter_39_7]
MDIKNNVTIVLVHGWTYKINPLKKLEDELNGLGYRVLVPTLPGFGQTNVPPTDWGISEYAQWLEEYIVNNAKAPVVLVGHSFGGAVCALCSAKYPTLASHLVVVNPSGVRTQNLILDIKKQLASWGSIIFSLPIISVFKSGVTKLWTKGTGSYDYAQAPEGLKSILSRVLSQDIREDLMGIKVPTLLLWARQDKATPFTMSKVWSEKIPQSTLVAVEGRGHSFLYEHPEIVVKEIMRFTQRT